MLLFAWNVLTTYTISNCFRKAGKSTESQEIGYCLEESFQGVVNICFQKGSKTSKEKFRPVSILLNVSKIFERILFYQYVLILIVLSRSTSMVLRRRLVPVLHHFHD